MNGILQDLRYALRQLLKNPGFSAIAVITLALGIGANIATFSVLNAVVLRPLPYPGPESLVSVTNYIPRVKARIVGSPFFVAWRNQTQSFEELAASDEGTSNLTGGSGPERIHFAGVTASMFSTLRVQPQSGRAFRAGRIRRGPHRS
jgi:putative ABC transport system permease protein